MTVWVETPPGWAHTLQELVYVVALLDGPPTEKFIHLRILPGELVADPTGHRAWPGEEWLVAAAIDVARIGEGDHGLHGEQPHG